MSTYEGDSAAIGNLIWNWGEVYIITYANGLYHAERRDNGAKVHAPDPGQLDHEIQSDYTARYPGTPGPACPAGAPPRGRVITARPHQLRPRRRRPGPE